MAGETGRSSRGLCERDAADGSRHVPRPCADTLAGIRAVAGLLKINRYLDTQAPRHVEVASQQSEMNEDRVGNDLRERFGVSRKRVHLRKRCTGSRVCRFLGGAGFLDNQGA